LVRLWAELSLLDAKIRRGLASTATLGAVFDRWPGTTPLLSPGKGQPAGQTGFGGEMRFFVGAHTFCTDSQRIKTKGAHPFWLIEQLQRFNSALEFDFE